MCSPQKGHFSFNSKVCLGLTLYDLPDFQTFLGKNIKDLVGRVKFANFQF